MWAIEGGIAGKRGTALVSVTLTVLILMFSSGGTVRAEDSYEYEVSVYDYDTGQLLIWATCNYSAPDNKYTTLFSIDRVGDVKDALFILNTTNAQVANVWIDKDDRRVYLEVGGPSGTLGNLELFVLREVIPNPGDVKVNVDNQPIEFTIEENNWWGDRPGYVIRAEFTLSTRMLMVDFGPGASPAWYAQPLNLALIAIAVVAALGAVYWLKFRK